MKVWDELVITTPGKKLNTFRLIDGWRIELFFCFLFSSPSSFGLCLSSSLSGQKGVFKGARREKTWRIYLGLWRDPLWTLCNNHRENKKMVRWASKTWRRILRYRLRYKLSRLNTTKYSKLPQHLQFFLRSRWIIFRYWKAHICSSSSSRLRQMLRNRDSWR